MTDITQMIEVNHIQEIPVPPVWLAVKLEPHARAVHTATGVLPWSLYYKSDREQSIIDYQLMSFHRIVQRMLTCPFEDIDALPLLSNGRTQLDSKPWEPPKKRITRKRVAK